MAAARLVVGAFVALFCAGAVMGAAPAELATWLEKSAGLSDKKASTAIALCETKEIETVDELREVYDRGRLDQLGFMPFTLGRIEDALKGVPAVPQPRRMQDQQQGSACVDSQGEIRRLWSQVDALLANTQASVVPTGTIVQWFGNASSLPAGWAECDGRFGTPDLRGKFVLAAGTRDPIPVNDAQRTGNNPYQGSFVPSPSPLQISVPVGDWVAERGVGPSGATSEYAYGCDPTADSCHNHGGPFPHAFGGVPYVNYRTVALGATAGTDDALNTGEAQWRYYGDGQPSPSEEAVQFGLMPGLDAGDRHVLSGYQLGQGYGGFNNGLPQRARRGSDWGDGPSNAGAAGAPIFGLTYAMKVATVCCVCRCDSNFSPSSTANLGPGQDREAVCAAHCGVGGPECGAEFAGRFVEFC